MEPILQPGITVPAMTFLAANLGKQVAIGDGRATVLVFCPAHTSDALRQYEMRLEDFASINVKVIIVLDSTGGALVKPAEIGGSTLPLVHDVQIAEEFGVRRATGSLLPSVFVIDEDRLICRVYEGDASDRLPNPAMVLRAIRGLANIPKPAPIKGDDWCLGPREAPVAIIEYSDYQCSHCAQVHQVLEQILPLYAGKMVYVHRHFPLRHSHPLAQLAAEAVEGAGAQGRFWEMHKRLFAHFNDLSHERIIACAQDIGINGEQLALDLEMHTFQHAVEDDFRLALADRVKFPPALFVNRILFEGPRTREAICARINSLLACISSHGENPPPRTNL